MNSPHDPAATSDRSDNPVAEAGPATDPERVGPDSRPVGIDDSASGELPDQPPTDLDGEASESSKTVATPGIPVPAAPPGADAPRRVLKLVLTLKPGDGPGAMRVVMALGAEGCDPLLRSEEVENLQAALDLVPGVLAEAEAR